MLNAKVCINAGDDLNHQKRIAKYPGPRCYTCDVLKRRQAKKANHDTYVQRTYGVPKGFFEKLFRYQKGRCWWCQRATGRSKKLANDHNHKCCPGTISCGKCLRGLLCSKCNRHLGWLGDDPEAMLRGYYYLKDPPAQRLMRELEGESEQGRSRQAVTTIQVRPDSR